jgi:hypothetical protein
MILKEAWVAMLLPVYIIRNPDIYNTENDLCWADPLRLFPIFLAPLPEKAESLRPLLSVLREQARNLRPVIWGGMKHIFEVKALTGDNSFVKKALCLRGGKLTPIIGAAIVVVIGETSPRCGVGEL